LSILNAIVQRRVLQYFKIARGTDPTAAARVTKTLEIERLEDPGNRIHCVDVIVNREGRWVISIHERIFDYLAFVIPINPDSRLGDGTIEERKMLAFSEFLLRHEIDHTLYPLRTERDIVKSDVEFAMNRRENDPTFYRDLRKVLADEMIGLKGRRYLELFDNAEREAPFGGIVTEIVNSFAVTISDIPLDFIEEVFLGLQTELQTKVLGTWYRRSRDTTYSLTRRTASLRKLLRVFYRLVDTDAGRAEVVFNAFKERWGLVYLLHELGVPEISVEDKDSRQLYELFGRALKEFSEETEGLHPMRRPEPAVSPAKSVETPVAQKSLKDRIEEARKDPAFPEQVMDVIDKNKLNAVGHSGSKYSELIETLLAVPWGKTQKIRVTPEAFEEGLDLSHYGLERPKEILCDFFSNLIWRYRHFNEGDANHRRKDGSSFLFVGPPGVGKTSLAISIAKNLGIPYHKFSLGGMRDEADLRGHGFTYEGSKPGAIVQGLIKMGVTNGMFIMDEADKTEKFAIATLLEILDPEQNHLFHDKFTQSTVDIDLSNCHFILTANTLDTVPPPVVNRCEVVVLDRYSVDEKICIARTHLIDRVRERYSITEDHISIAPDSEADLLRHIIKTYTHEAGVRELERIIRTLFLRIMRKEILGRDSAAVKLTREQVKEYLNAPARARVINEDDRVGEMTALGVNVERGMGSIIPVQATPVRAGHARGNGRGYLSMVNATGNIEHIMDESRKVAVTAILHCAETLNIDLQHAEAPIHLHFMGGSTPKDGPSAGGAIALALASVLSGRRIRRDVAMTGEIDTQGRVTSISGLGIKLETAYDAGCKTVLIPKENLHGADGIERLSDALKRELQVLEYEQWKGPHTPFDPDRHMLQIVAVDHITQAAEIALIDDRQLSEIEMSLVAHGRLVAESIPKLSETDRLPCTVVYAKALWEMGSDGSHDRFWEDNGSYVLVRPSAGKDLAEQFPALEENRRLWNFDPTEQAVTETLRDIVKHLHVCTGHRFAPALIAPFFFLKRDLKTLSGFSPGPDFQPLKLFANNYTCKGFKIKSCKPVLNRVYYYLSRLSVEDLRACPFLTTCDDIYVLDPSFIPEALLLDASRAEKLIHGSLKRWLAAVEGKEGGEEKPALQTSPQA
ncbi:MAG: S16 family serine protease, partial [Desulfomonilaceae bacterium]|nr:S16 family serine protease [Desulfomonilaceae bacterium]